MGWLTLKCPVSEDERAWLEEASGWLIEEFSLGYVREVKALVPSDEFFPDIYRGEEEDIRQLFRRASAYAEVDPDIFRLEFFSSKSPELTDNPLVHQRNETAIPLGYFGTEAARNYIGLDLASANKPERLIATIAHELAHYVLISEGRIDESAGSDDNGHEYLADLATVFMGFGVFTANTALEFEQWTNNFAQGWQASGAGYMTEEMFAYALAIFAFVRNESSPDWSHFLKTNIRSYFKDSYKYIEKNGAGAAGKAISLQG